MKKTLCAFIGLLFTVLSFAASNRFDTMVIFGDSLSDHGNLYRYMWYKFPASPPYFKGRFTNGLLWIEQLYESYYPHGCLDGFQNYAVGGAGAVLSYKQNLPLTLTMELNDYLYWNTYGKKETSLYFIWIGANNYLNGPTNVESLTDSVVEAIGGVIERIISHGGNKFFIANLPDLGRVPQARDMGIEALLTRLIQTHNRKLAAKIDSLKLKYPNVIWVYFDVYTLLNEAIDSPSAFGLSDVIEPCYWGSYSGWLRKHMPGDNALAEYFKERDSRFDDTQWRMIKNNPQLKEAASVSMVYDLLPHKLGEQPLNCDGYLFWDRVHPTAYTHAFISLKARELIDAAGLVAFNSEAMKG